MFQVSTLFKANYQAADDIIVNQGGSSSGKTYSILQVLISKAISEPKSVITVVGQDLPNLRAGALRDCLDIFDRSDEAKSFLESYNKSSLTFLFTNGSLMEFKSYEDEQDAKSGKRDYLFINEANGIRYGVYMQLQLRTRKQTFIDYNPTSSFWCHDHLIGQPGVKFLISDHRHNPFCPPKIAAKLEALKDKDIELFNVYARGKTGKILGLIFRNWNLCPMIHPDATLIGHGLDFGFTNDPTAGVSVYKHNGKLWLKEILYEYELTNPDIASKLTAKAVQKHEPIVADSAEPKSIKEISNLGFRIESAQKGPDSIRNGIDIIKRYEMMVTADSVNLRKELNSYKWAVDKNGEPLNVPVDFNNHLMDALRYVGLNKLDSAPSGKYFTINV